MGRKIAAPVAARMSVVSECSARRCLYPVRAGITLAPDRYDESGTDEDK